MKSEQDYMRYLKSSMRCNEDSKLLYLVALENPFIYGKLLRRKAFFESVERYLVNLQPLARWGLINQHPLFLADSLSKDEIKRVNGVQVTVVNTSPQALLWALSDRYDTFPEAPEDALSHLQHLSRNPSLCLQDIWDGNLLGYLDISRGANLLRLSEQAQHIPYL